ncbi:MAG: bacteriorhodopsin [Gemmatimonadaceae bacterium]|nr:bacteriorhodopsin [Gemmatimonadaceae bacterium]
MNFLSQSSRHRVQNGTDADRAGEVATSARSTEWHGFAVVNGELTLTGVKFNDAYRYVDWLLTVPLLLIELFGE